MAFNTIQSPARSIPLLLLGLLLLAGDAGAVGQSMFSTGSTSGEKPQSKIWYNDGSFWCILDGPDGVAFYRKSGNNWNKGAFADAEITSSGQADVKWNGNNLFVLVYSGSPKLYKYSYDSGTQSFSLLSGFPVDVPNPSGSETMVIDLDSDGTLWATAEGGGDIHVYWTTNSTHTNWSSGHVLQSGVSVDDISSIVAFDGNKVGVFWSDQNRDEFGFRVHVDGNSPTSWGGVEVADSGSGVADDHLNLATDSSGQVYAVTKDASDEHTLHVRSPNGNWTSENGVASGDGTRGIVMVSEADNEVYVLYTNWSVSPNTIEYRVANSSTLNFGSATVLLESGGDMNNVTGMKQVLPENALMAIGTLDDSEAWWNGFGSPDGGPPPPEPPSGLSVSLNLSPASVDLNWSTPSTGTPDGYHIYREVDGGGFIQINGSLVTNNAYTDSSPPFGVLCYRVTAVNSGSETLPSNTDCVDNSMPEPPSNLTASLDEAQQEVALNWDEPTTGAPDSYEIYRQVSGGSFQFLTSVSGGNNQFTDTSPPEESLCYQVTALNGTDETDPTNSDCVDNTPPAAPDAPVALTTSVLPAHTLNIVCELQFMAHDGQVVSDLSGGNNHARLGSTYGSDSADPSWTSGVSDNAVEFDGSDDYLEIAHDDGLVPSQSFSLEAWIYRSTAAAAVIVSKGTDGERSYEVSLDSAGQATFAWDNSSGSAQAVQSTQLLSLDQWHHLAVVYDATNSENRIYVDGAPTIAGVSGTPQANTSPIRLGTDQNFGGFFAGRMDRLIMCETALYDAAFLPSAAPAAKEAVQLEWQAATTGTEATQFRVYRSLDGGGSQLLATLTAANTRYVDFEVGESSACYEITALNNRGFEGPASSTACENVGPMSPLPLGPPLDFQLQESGGVLLTWQPPGGGASPIGYNVYRHQGGAYSVKLTPSPVSELQFIDPSPAAGNNCYRVHALSSPSREGLATPDSCVFFVPAPPTEPENVAVEPDSILASAGGVAAFNLDAGSGQWALDITGNGHDAVLGNSPEADSADPVWGEGVPSSGLMFDGANDRLQITSTPALELSGSFTLEAWFRKTAGSGTGCLLGKGGSQERNFRLRIEGGGDIEFMWETAGGSNHGTTATSAVNDDQWHHMAAVYDMNAGENRIYLDGALIQSESDSGTPFTNTDPVYIGARISSSSLTDFFSGSMDLVRISDTAVYTENFTPPMRYTPGPLYVNKISWSPPTHGEIKGYNVYRSLTPGVFDLIASEIPDTTFADADSLTDDPCYRVSAVDVLGQEGAQSIEVCPAGRTTTDTGDLDDPSRAPLPHMIAGPNPFNPATTIRFSLSTASHVRLEIFDARGRRIRRLLHGERDAGLQVVHWNGRDGNGREVAAGIYFVHLAKSASQGETIKITLVK